jgi:RNA polymerase sigma factor (sigma-70 family)
MPPENAEQASWFASEVQPHEAALRAYLRARFPSLLDIDDLIQDTYVRFMRAWQAGHVRQPRAFLFATARNVAVDFFRRRQIVSIDGIADIESLTVVEDRPDAAETACHDQELEILTQAIRALPARCREVLTLRRIAGLSHREIARQLQISEHTVNAQLAIGIVRCREYLRSRGVVARRFEQSSPAKKNVE